ncbi:MAG: hypothetical protein V4520_09990 [Bacteroidota bacterium]
MKNTLYILLALLLNSDIGKAQQNIDTTIYFNLSSVKFRYNEVSRTVQLTTKRKVKVYMFSIPCKNCQTGINTLGFYGHDNPETGANFDPIIEISNSQYKQLKFLSFEKLVWYLKCYELKKRIKIYFIETKNNRHYRYDVRMDGFFGTE